MAVGVIEEIITTGEIQKNDFYVKKRWNGKKGKNDESKNTLKENLCVSDLLADINLAITV